ncbi:MAG: flagellar motor protein MotD [Gammaproteobacteria bacterium]|nr:MAG: flagellar motor protein MotD [Gammaproteobacteria bacterium]
MARKKHAEEHENHERWLVSYADFITLLFAFFVVMYSISAVNEGKYRVLSDSLEAAFRSKPMSDQPIQIGQPSKSIFIENSMAKSTPGVVSSAELKLSAISPPIRMNQNTGADAKKPIDKIADQVEKLFAPLLEDGLMMIKRNDMWIEIEMKSNILFPPGSAKLTETAKPVLVRLASVLKKYPNHIRIEGYTDNSPINTVLYPTNWELSAVRSASVIHLLIREGLEPESMAAVGYGRYKPSSGNGTLHGRNENRKVVLVVLGQDVPHHFAEFARISEKQAGVSIEGVDASANGKP